MQRLKYIFARHWLVFEAQRIKIHPSMQVVYNGSVYAVFAPGTDEKVLDDVHHLTSVHHYPRSYIPHFCVLVYC